MNRAAALTNKIAASLLGVALAMGCVARATTEVPAVSADPAETRSKKIVALGPVQPPWPEYYVSVTGDDANDGSRSRPWATISRASSAAVPGTTIHVAPGRYFDSVVTTARGTPDRRIQYISDKKWAAAIDPRHHGIFAWKNTGDYTDIVGFEIAGADCNGIGLGGSFQRAIGNNVHNAALGCHENPGSGSGINDFDYSTRDNEIVENYVHDVGTIDASCGLPKHNLIHGIYQANAGGRIEQNIVANNCAFGIHLWHAATHATIKNNTVVGNHSGGIIVGSGDAPCMTGGCPGGDDFTIVANNIVAFNGTTGSSGWGISEEAESGGTTGVHNQYSRNLSFQNIRGDFTLDHDLPCRECIRGKDPMFVSVATGNFDFKNGSPALATWPRADIPNELRPDRSGDVRADGRSGTTSRARSSDPYIGARGSVARSED